MATPGTPALTLEPETVAFLARRLADRQALAAAMAAAALTLWDPFPYRGLAGDSHGYPPIEPVEKKALDLARKSITDRNAQTRAGVIAIQQQQILLSGFQRALTTCRMRKFHDLRVYQFDVQRDEKRHLTLQANIGPTTARRLAQGI